TLAYTLAAPDAATANPGTIDRGQGNGSSPSSVAVLVSWIAGRYSPDERQLLVATPAAGVSATLPTGSEKATTPAGTLPLVHIVVPNKGSSADYDLNTV